MAARSAQAAGTSARPACSRVKTPARSAGARKAVDVGWLLFALGSTLCGAGLYYFIWRLSDAEGGPGMTLRDYFAGQVLAGRMARNSDYTSWEDAAKDAYEMADAMIAERDVWELINAVRSLGTTGWNRRRQLI